MGGKSWRGKTRRKKNTRGGKRKRYNLKKKVQGNRHFKKRRGVKARRLERKEGKE